MQASRPGKLCRKPGKGIRNMGQEEPLFTLVSSCPDKLVLELKPLLEMFGPGTLRCLSTAALTTHVLLPREVLIIDFVSIPLPETSEDILRLISTRPVLGLLPEHEIETPSRRVRVCSDVLAWPPDHKELETKLRCLCRQLARGSKLEQTLILRLNLVGESDAFQKVIGDIQKYAKCDAPVLITGETGTGKEMIARAVHYVGLADEKPFVAVNCGALPDNLVENELFGHVRGAYTDARQSQCGLVEQAEGGTLFLDEIEALSNKGQVALLRFLQDYEYRPLGARHSKQARLRLIAASNEPLQELIDQGVFRKDLFYRINILALALPPLRERTGDISLLAEHFVDKYRQFYAQHNKYLDPATLDWMSRYDWPGNVRELDNLILREFLLTDSSRISIAPLDGTLGERRRNMHDRRYRHLYARKFQDAKSSVVREFERSYLRHVLEDAKGNISQAARQAGKERRTFTKLLDKYGFTKKRYSDSSSSS